MSLIAYLLLTIPCLAIVGLYLESALHTCRLRRRGRCSADWLADRTGLFDRTALRALIGEPGSDGLYTVPDAALKTLPRNRWIRGPRHPLLMILIGAGLVAGFGNALTTGVPPWALGNACCGYLLLCVLWQMRWEAAKVRIEAATAPENDPESDINSSTPLPDIRDYLSGLRADMMEEQSREASRGDNSPFWKWVFQRMIRRKIRIIERWEQRVNRMMEGHEERLRKYRHQLIQVRWRRPQLERAIEEGRAPEGARELLIDMTHMEGEVEDMIREIQALIHSRPPRK